LRYNYAIYEDIDLVEMVRVDHDQLAFQEIYMRYADPLLHLAFRKTNSKEAAEDIVQITFIKLWARRENLKINHSLKAYLYTSTKNNVISYYLRQLSKKTITLDSVQEDLLPQETTQQDIDYANTLQLYNESLQELPDKCREVFMLSRKGYSLKEIAEIKNISPKTAEVHIGKALRYLRKKLRGNHNLFLLAFYVILK
jgi:RNA polymerase sigma-70 factor (ECF subfamily)